MSSSKQTGNREQRTAAQSTELLQELVSHLRQNRTQLREEWANRITEAQLLTAMTKEELFAEATSVYDNYVEALAADEQAFNDTVVFVNISEHGARFISCRKLPAGKRVIISDSLVNFRATAEVIYCTPHSSRRYAVG